MSKTFNFKFGRKRKTRERVFLILRVVLGVVILVVVFLVVNGSGNPFAQRLPVGKQITPFSSEVQTPDAELKGVSLSSQMEPKVVTGIVDVRVSLVGGGKAHLVGDASHDPDGGDLVRYIWRVKESPISVQVGKIIADTANAPDQSYNTQSIGKWVYELEVVDDEGESALGEQVVYVQQSVETILSPRKVKASQVDFLSGDDQLVGVVIDGQAVAYPASVVYPHAVVNDVVAGEPIYVVFCEACQTGIVKSRVADKKVITIQGFGGTLEEDDFFVKDEETGSKWHVIYGEAKSGPLKGVMLDEVDFELVNWQTWRRQYPNSLVLAGEG